jgi:hypothetical protein
MLTIISNSKVQVFCLILYTPVTRYLLSVSINYDYVFEEWDWMVYLPL